jgi:hypothetical protein
LFSSLEKYLILCSLDNKVSKYWAPTAVALDKSISFADCFIINLGDYYTGGELKLFDNWVDGDKNDFVTLNETSGTVTFFKPYHHAQLSPILNGNRYEIYLLLRHTDIKNKIKHLL